MKKLILLAGLLVISFGAVAMEGGGEKTDKIAVLDGEDSGVDGSGELDGVESLENRLLSEAEQSLWDRDVTEVSLSKFLEDGGFSGAEGLLEESKIAVREGRTKTAIILNEEDVESLKKKLKGYCISVLKEEVEVTVADGTIEKIRLTPTSKARFDAHEARIQALHDAHIEELRGKSEEGFDARLAEEVKKNKTDFDAQITKLKKRGAAGIGAGLIAIAAAVAGGAGGK